MMGMERIALAGNRVGRALSPIITQSAANDITFVIYFPPTSPHPTGARNSESSILKRGEKVIAMASRDAAHTRFKYIKKYFRKYFLRILYLLIFLARAFVLGQEAPPPPLHLLPPAEAARE